MSLDLTKSQDVKKYLEMRANQIKQYDKPEVKDALGSIQTPARSALISQVQLACGCILHEYYNADDTNVRERDWCNNPVHTDGAVLDIT